MHGGLLDADGPFPASDYRRFDPSRGDAAPGRPTYWYFDLARKGAGYQYTTSITNNRLVTVEHMNHSQKAPCL